MPLCPFFFCVTPALCAVLYCLLQCSSCAPGSSFQSTSRSFTLPSELRYIEAHVIDDRIVAIFGFSFEYQLEHTYEINTDTRDYMWLITTHDNSETRITVQKMMMNINQQRWDKRYSK